VDQSFRKRFYDGDLDLDEVTEFVEGASQRFVAEAKPSFEKALEDYFIEVTDPVRVSVACIVQI
jgi:hypothetical protein